MVLYGIMAGIIFLLCVKLANKQEEYKLLEQLLKDKQDLIDFQNETINQLLNDETK